MMGPDGSLHIIPPDPAIAMQRQQERQDHQEHARFYGHHTDVVNNELRTYDADMRRWEQRPAETRGDRPTPPPWLTDSARENLVGPLAAFRDAPDWMQHVDLNSPTTRNAATRAEVNRRTDQTYRDLGRERPRQSPATPGGTGGPVAPGQRNPATGRIQPLPQGQTYQPPVPAAPQQGMLGGQAMPGGEAGWQGAPAPAAPAAPIPVEQGVANFLAGVRQGGGAPPGTQRVLPGQPGSAPPGQHPGGIVARPSAQEQTPEGREAIRQQTLARQRDVIRHLIEVGLPNWYGGSRRLTIQEAERYVSEHPDVRVADFTDPGNRPGR
jgi:hypothetical protein